MKTNKDVKIIKKYISQKAIGYTQDFKQTILLCEVEYTDDSFNIIQEYEDVLKEDTEKYFGDL